MNQKSIIGGKYYRTTPMSEETKEMVRNIVKHTNEIIALKPGSLFLVKHNFVCIDARNNNEETEFVKDTVAMFVGHSKESTYNMLYGKKCYKLYFEQLLKMFETNALELI